MGLREPEKREKANHGQYMMWKSENGPQQAQSNENKESKGFDGKPMSPKDENKVIGPGKPNEISKSPS